MDNEQKTLSIFCANCQKETPHTGAVDLNGELVFTCTSEGCGRFIKVPAKMSAADIHAHFAEHKEANVGQVSIAESYAALDDVFATAEETKPAKDAKKPAK